MSLEDLVRVAVNETDQRDPGEIAALVREQLTADLCEEYVNRRLRNICYQVLVAYAPPRQPSPEPQQPVTPRGASRSRTQAVRDWFQCERRTFCGANGVFKPLGQFTAADCVAAIRTREEIAAANVAEADKFRRAAKELEQHRATTWAMLPKKVRAELDDLMAQ